MVFAILLVVGLGLMRGVQSSACQSVVIASSNEKSDLMASLANDYSTSHAVAGCGPVVTVERIASGDAEQKLALGWTGAGRPDVWTPQASSWALLLNYQLTTTRRTVIVPDAPLPSIANSPLVVAMPQLMAVALGWPSHQPSWRDVLALAEDPQGWAAAGKPEWGAFRLGKTDPATSTSGMHALIAAYYAATRKSSDLTQADVDSAHPFVAAVEASVSHYADTADTFLRNLSAADDNGQALSYVSAVTIEEQELWAYNHGAYSTRNVPPRVLLAAVYPSDGTLIADHPYVVLQAPWVGVAKRRIADDFLQWLLESPQQQRFADTGFRDSRGKAPVSLSADGTVLPDQPSLELRLPSPATLSSIETSWSQIRKRVRLLIVLDVKSGSALVAIAAAIAELSTDDVVELWTVADSPAAPFRRVVPATRVGVGIADIQAAIKSSTVGTAPRPLYAATDAAYGYLSGAPDRTRINAIVLIADQPDDGAGPALAALERDVRPQPAGILVRIYAVAFPGSSATALQGIATASAGFFTEGEPGKAVRQALTNT